MLTIYKQPGSPPSFILDVGYRLGRAANLDKLGWTWLRGIRPDPGCWVTRCQTVAESLGLKIIPHPAFTRS